MFQTTSRLSVFAGLLFAAACARPVAPSTTRDGKVEFVLGSVEGDAVDTAPGRLTLTGLDRTFRAQVELPRSGASRGVHVELPAGLYAVDATASMGGAEPVIPALSAPRFVVVAAGRVTTVNVSSVDSKRTAVAAL